MTQESDSDESDKENDPAKKQKVDVPKIEPVRTTIEWAQRPADDPLVLSIVSTIPVDSERLI